VGAEAEVEWVGAARSKCCYRAERGQVQGMECEEMQSIQAHGAQAGWEGQDTEAILLGAGAGGKHGAA